MLAKKEGICRDPWSNEQQDNNASIILNISGLTYSETRICRLCMCVQNEKVPLQDQVGLKDSGIGHFPSSQILGRLNEMSRLTHSCPKICRFLIEYIHIQRHKWTRIDKNVHTLRHRYEGFRREGTLK